MQKHFCICLICKLPGFREHRLCRHCARELRHLQQPVIREADGFVIRSLFPWRVNDKRCFTDLVYSLKGIDDANAWFELSVWMADHFRRDPKGLPQKPIIIPIPGRAPNHAMGLAKAVGRVVGGDVVDALVPVKKRSQKTLDKSQRRQVEFVLRSGHLCTDYNTVIIVDDVITTGATAEAAFKALHRPKNCEVWCLMDRRPCGDLGALL